MVDIFKEVELNIGEKETADIKVLIEVLKELKNEQTEIIAKEAMNYAKSNLMKGFGVGSGLDSTIIISLVAGRVSASISSTCSELIEGLEGLIATEKETPVATTKESKTETEEETIETEEEITEDDMIEVIKLLGKILG